ncbi:hypothetical protein Acr_17g0001170 [Actinidia rufa]|uniref:Multidrug resistance protein ABC transporter family protein n=1 Tax=Actinidia rufa TaxID=165716 RepID=A0A7J0G192_9ERIC|nr:hypothetical protein Acr_17g0001170 [Actinidia rufa]
MGCQVSSTGKVILPDGTVQEYDQTLTVAELMLEHPQQVVVEFESTVNVKRLSPLPADKKLEKGKVYLMMPKRRGKPPALSSEETRMLLSISNSVLSSRTLLSSLTGFVPSFAPLCSTARRGEGHGVVLSRKVDLVDRFEEMTKGECLPEFLEGRPEFLNRQFSGGKGWKPSLDTIKEKVVKKKVSHWLF